MDERGVFVEKVLAVLRADAAWTSVTYDAASFALRADTAKGSSTFFLAPLFARYQSVGHEERDEVVRGWASAIIEGAAQLQASDARSSLGARDGATPAREGAVTLPRVADRDFWSLARLQLEAAGRDASASHVQVAALGPFMIALCVDGAKIVRYMTANEIATKRTTFEELLATAYANLERLTPEPRFTSPRPGVHVSAWHDSHDASRCLLLPMIEALRVRGAPVVMVPSPDVLIVTGADDPAGLTTAAELAVDAMTKASKPLCGFAAVANPKYRALELPVGHPAEKALKLLRATALHGAYATQKTLLDTLNQRSGYDIHVAECRAYVKPDGDALTMCSWSTAVTLLPVTDVVVLTKVVMKGGAPELARAPVATTSAALARFVPRFREVKPSLSPSRLLVDFFPSDAELDTIERLGAVPKPGAR